MENTTISSVENDVRTSFACFNGGRFSTGNRNLEEYLNLIVNASQPQITSQYKFYSNQKLRILNGTKIQQILSEENFLPMNGESNHKQLWKVLVNSAHEFNSKVGSDLITYLINNISNYSLLEYEELGIGLRRDAAFYIVKILDQAGWVDEGGFHRNNFDENLLEIPEWVFGVGRHRGEGVTKKLSENRRGIIGLFDLLAFRLYCSADRGGDIFNLSRALAKYSNPDAPVEGPTRNIAVEEMRLISQEIFKIFKRNYISKKINIFDLVQDLGFVDLTGNYTKFVRAKIKSGEFKGEKEIVGKTRSTTIGFIVYQLGSSSHELGIACGYYDPQGDGDKNGIKAEVNAYLFDVCFNPARSRTNGSNYKHFLDYLLINLSSVFEVVKGRQYIPHINEFTKVLDKKKLYDYWKTNSEIIKSLHLENKTKTIWTPNYKATYKGDLLDVYKVLDDLVTETEAAQSSSPAQQPSES